MFRAICPFPSPSSALAYAKPFFCHCLYRLKSILFLRVTWKIHLATKNFSIYRDTAIFALKARKYAAQLRKLLWLLNEFFKLHLNKMEFRDRKIRALLKKASFKKGCNKIKTSKFSEGALFQNWIVTSNSKMHLIKVLSYSFYAWF